MSKKKCSWCNAIRKKSGVTYLVCQRCKEQRKKQREERRKNNIERKRNSEELNKISRKLNKESINKFKKERGIWFLCCLGCFILGLVDLIKAGYKD